MPALLDTTTHERVGRGPKASPSVALSFHENQRGRAFARGLSRARDGYGVVRVDHVVEADPISLGPALTILLPVELARALSRVLFQPNSHWSRFSSVAVTNRGVELSRPPRVNSSAFFGSRRSRAHPLPVEQFLQSLAYRDHHSIVLFHGCTVREVSCATKGLGNVRKAFGELRNV